MNKNNPLVSVGIPTYSRPEGLRRTLECITRQTYRNLEIIVSDNCSPGPETENIARKYMRTDPRIRYIRQEENKGIEFNFRFVLDQAEGEYFIWAADDDTFDQSFIEECLEGFSLSDHVICVSSLVDRFESIADEKFLLSYDYYSNIGMNTYQRVKDISIIILSGKKRIATLMCGLFPREVITKIVIKSQLGEDLLFLLEYSTKGEYHTIPKKLFRKYGPRKTPEELKRLLNVTFTEKPYRYLFRKIFQVIDSMDDLTSWEKYTIKFYLHLIYCRYRVIKPYIFTLYKWYVSCFRKDMKIRTGSR